MYKNNNFDVVVVGSSLISVMKAIEESKKDRKVCLIEERNDFGGMWATHEVDGYGLIETSCHLLEYYKGSYEKISRLLNVKFETFESQPITLFSNGKVRPIQSRLSLLTEPLKGLIRYISIILVKFFNFFLFYRFKIKRGKDIDLTHEWKAIKFSFKYKFCGFFSFKGVQIPVDGYSIFTMKIMEAMNKQNIYNISGKKASEIKIHSDKVLLKIGSEKITARKVYISESTNTNILNFNVKPRKSNKFKEFPHILVYVNSLKTKNFPNYIAFRGDIDFKRLVFLKNHYQNTNEGLFLIQTKRKMKKDSLLDKEKVKSLMLRCNLVENDVQIEINNHFNSLGVKNGIFTPGKLSDRVTCLETIGDLTKKVALHF
jgi:hypothetical protein